MKISQLILRILSRISFRFSIKHVSIYLTIHEYSITLFESYHPGECSFPLFFSVILSTLLQWGKRWAWVGLWNFILRTQKPIHSTASSWINKWKRVFFLLLFVGNIFLYQQVVEISCVGSCVKSRRWKKKLTAE